MFFWATGCTYHADSACWAEYRTNAACETRFNNPNRAWTLNIPFSFNAAQTFSMQMWATANAYAQTFMNADGIGYAAFQAESDYMHTAALDGVIGVLDKNGC